MHDRAAAAAAAVFVPVPADVEEWGEWVEKKRQYSRMKQADADAAAADANNCDMSGSSDDNVPAWIVVIALMVVAVMIACKRK